MFPAAAPARKFLVETKPSIHAVVTHVSLIQMATILPQIVMVPVPILAQAETVPLVVGFVR